MKSFGTFPKWEFLLKVPLWKPSILKENISLKDLQRCNLHTTMAFWYPFFSPLNLSSQTGRPSRNMFPSWDPDPPLSSKPADDLRINIFKLSEFVLSNLSYSKWPQLPHCLRSLPLLLSHADNPWLWQELLSLVLYCHKITKKQLIIQGHWGKCKVILFHGFLSTWCRQSLIVGRGFVLAFILLQPLQKIIKHTREYGQVQNWYFSMVFFWPDVHLIAFALEWVDPKVVCWDSAKFWPPREVASLKAQHSEGSLKLCNLCETWTCKPPVWAVSDDG